jgi:hypothetical protein
VKIPTIRHHPSEHGLFSMEFIEGNTLNVHYLKNKYVKLLEGYEIASLGDFAVKQILLSK